VGAISATVSMGERGMLAVGEKRRIRGVGLEPTRGALVLCAVVYEHTTRER